MALDLQQRPFDWREKTMHLAWKLDRAHSAMEDLGTALDDGDIVSARHVARTAQEVVGSVAHAVKEMRDEQPASHAMNDTDAIALSLAIGGSGVAAIALDVMVNAMVALAATDEEDDTDFLIGACVDAESAFEVSAAVVKAAPRRGGPAIRDLQRAFETDGEVALRRRLTARVLEINERVRGDVLAER